MPAPVAFHEDEDTEDLLPPPLFNIAAVGYISVVVVVTCMVSVDWHLASHDAGCLPGSGREGNELCQLPALDQVVAATAAGSFLSKGGAAVPAQEYVYG